MSFAALDVGGANVKGYSHAAGAVVRSFELWKRPESLARRLAEVLSELSPFDSLALTMTGELCDCFATKADGVRHILRSARSACQRIAAEAPVSVWRTDSRLAPLETSLVDPLPAAASNWLALAWFAADLVSDNASLLVDVGSTTTDIIPLANGRPVPDGVTDTERLLAGELVYTGTSRTPVAAVVREVPFRGRSCPLASEFFATTLDAYLILNLAEEAPTDFRTADGRPATRACAHDRLARMVCADRGTFDEEDARRAARHVVEQQELSIRRALMRVVSRQKRPPSSILVSGSGELLARRAVATLGVPIRSIEAELGPEISAAATAYALARLAERRDPH